MRGVFAQLGKVPEDIRKVLLQSNIQLHVIVDQADMHHSFGSSPKPVGLWKVPYSRVCLILTIQSLVYAND